MIIVIGILAVLAFGGYRYFMSSFINAGSDLDVKTKAEQSEELLANPEFKELPEVIELKHQLEQLAGGSDNTGGQVQGGLPGVTAPGPFTQQEIEGKLRQRMLVLQAEYNGRMNGLIASAKKEYIQLQSGQTNVSKKDLLQKYLGMVEKLEAECDARIYATLAIAENQLDSQGLTSAVPDEARAAYRMAKKDKRQEILSKI